MRLMPLFLVVLLPCQSLAVQQKCVTLYLDGARVELEEGAKGGYLELPLPPSMVPGTLRVLPVGAGSVTRVEVGPAAAGQGASRERARLTARKEALEDRMQALRVREEVFTAAARSQSGKSPRKTRNNPDPVGALKQGTEFALSQLEGVYRARRKCETELKEIERDLSRQRVGESARVWLTARRARLSYLTKTPGWTPYYTFLLDGTGHCELSLQARLPPAEKGVRYLVAPGALARAASPQPASGALSAVARLAVTLTKAEYTELPYPALTFSFTGGEGWLPAGDAAAYWKGAFLGNAHFAGGGAGELFFGR